MNILGVAVALASVEASSSLALVQVEWQLGLAAS